MTEMIRQPRAPLAIRCPTTGNTVETGISTDADSLAKNWHGDIRLDCSCCGGTHQFALKDVFLAQAVAGFSLGGPVEAERA
jgi:hypothetical protein